MMVLTINGEEEQAIERLEGFRPDGHGIYQPVMVIVDRGSNVCSVWICIIRTPQNGHRINYANQPIIWKSQCQSPQNALFWQTANVICGG